MKYDRWELNLGEHIVDLFETGLENPVVTITMEELLAKAGYVKRTESGK